MKGIAYFHLATASDDDVALGEAKVMGYVPTTCLLGGSTVWKHISLDLDPCRVCHGPRAKCGGREIATPEEIALEEGARRLRAEWLGF